MFLIGLLDVFVFFKYGKIKNFSITQSSNMYYQRKKQNPPAMKAKGKFRKIVVNDNYQFVDNKITVNASTTSGRFSLFTQLANLLGTVPQMAEPILQNGNVEWRARIYISHIELRTLCVGSQSNTLVAGDLFNNVRFVVSETRDAFGIASTPTLVGVADPLQVADKRFVHLDHMYNVMTQAFNGAGYNVPGVHNDLFNIPINRTFDWFTLVTTGASGWDTKTGNIECATVSDSSVTPNPSITYTSRIYFKILKSTGRGNGQ
jgi:hypothetical protein